MPVGRHFFIRPVPSTPILVPFPGFKSISSLPPIASTRSRIPTRPRCPSRASCNSSFGRIKPAPVVLDGQADLLRVAGQLHPDLRRFGMLDDIIQNSPGRCGRAQSQPVLAASRRPSPCAGAFAVLDVSPRRFLDGSGWPDAGQN